MQQAFEQMDLDNSGFITIPNLQALLGDEFTKEQLALMIDEVDQARDGRISFDEFCAAMRAEAKRPHSAAAAAAEGGAVGPPVAEGAAPQPATASASKAE